MIREVDAIEAGDDSARLVEGELLDDVVAHLWRSSGRQRDRWRIAQALAGSGDPQVAGPEIVAPLAYAMRFINSQKTDAHVLQALGDGAEVETLRCEIKEAYLTACSSRETVGDLRRLQSAVDIRRG